jgi:predicted exporter/lauroyl/myristoyl acyltransferase
MKSDVSKPASAPASHRSLSHPGRWIWLIVAVPIAIGLVRLRFDVEVFDLLPSDLRVVQGLKLYQEHFANARELVLTLEGKNAEETAAAAQNIALRLRARADLVSSVTWQPPWLEHPEDSAEIIAYLWLNQPRAVFMQLTNRLAPGKLPELLSAARDELASSFSPQEIARLSYDPFGFTRLPEEVSGAAPSFTEGQELFSSSEGTFRVMFIKAASKLGSYRDCERWLGQIKQAVDAAAAASAPTATPPGSSESSQLFAKAGSPNPQGNRTVRIGYTGRPAFVSEIAAGMERDMTWSVIGTAAIIAFLFWLSHRRLKPMLWLLVLLARVLVSTLGLGGLIFGTINVISMGFAAILLGLAVDYAVVHYQEALTQPHLSIAQIRHAIAPSIFWAAVTTVSAFLVLNFGGLPGLGQLGTLVALGVALAATIMIFEFLPPLFPERNRANFAGVPGNPAAAESARPAPGLPNGLAFLITAGLFLTTFAVLIGGLPRLDSTARALRPRHSAAYATLDKIQARLNRNRDPLWLIAGGADLDEVGKKLDAIQRVLDGQKSNGVVSDFTLPTTLWPRPKFEKENGSAASALLAQREIFRKSAFTNGFAPAALAFTDRVLDAFAESASNPNAFWPTNELSRWIFEKLTAQSAGSYFAFGLINLAQDREPKNGAVALEAELPRAGAWLSGWGLLGSAILSRIQANFWKVIGPMVCLCLFSLYFAFRRGPEITLSIGALGLSGLCVLAAMRLAGWSWNLLNLMAIPLVLGTGIDYSLFIQLALRRYGGDLWLTWRSVGRALLLCGGRAITGFGSLAFSSNSGMAGLGKICALGVGCNMLVAIFLLPAWWRRFCFPGMNAGMERPDWPIRRIAAPSSLYRPEFWRLGLIVARTVPSGILHWLSAMAVRLYCRVARHRREIVFQNLLPVFNADRAAAARAAELLFLEFGRKLVDLWRYEAGLPIQDLVGETSGWEYFEQAQAQKRGILLVTPHLGNWEFGGPMLTGRGVALQVITLAEPGERFTQLRLASRAKWKIETLVIGNDPLAFVEIIHRLEQGATVALLIDRPPAPTAVTVELFGRPFAASIAAAELARASGCALLPVYVPRQNGKYAAHMLPAVHYDRPALRERAARRELTQRIISSFEPVIRRHADQWFHFVPVWSEPPK